MLTRKKVNKMIKGISNSKKLIRNNKANLSKMFNNNCKRSLI